MYKGYILLVLIIAINIVCAKHLVKSKRNDRFKAGKVGGKSKYLRHLEESKEVTTAASASSSGPDIPPPPVPNAAMNKNALWPLGIVPYYINTDTYDEQVVGDLKSQLNYIESVTCVKFKAQMSPPDDTEHNWLHFDNPRNEKKCVHQPTKEANGEILVVLGFECLQRTQLLHSVLHALGLRDEVTHPRRDEYIKVLWENIQPEYRMLFRTNNEGTVNGNTVEYDPMSVMHFHDRAFSRNGQATVLPLLPGLLIQPSQTLSQLDQVKIRLLFSHECNRRDVGELLDTCKMALHEDNKVEPSQEAAESSKLSLEDESPEGDDLPLCSSDNDGMRLPPNEEEASGQVSAASSEASSASSQSNEVVASTKEASSTSSNEVDASASLSSKNDEVVASAQEASAGSSDAVATAQEVSAASSDAELSMPEEVARRGYKKNATPLKKKRNQTAKLRKGSSKKISQQKGK